MADCVEAREAAELDSGDDRFDSNSQYKRAHKIERDSRQGIGNNSAGVRDGVVFGNRRCCADDTVHQEALHSNVRNLTSPDACTPAVQVNDFHVSVDHHVLHAPDTHRKVRCNNNFQDLESNSGLGNELSQKNF